MRLKQPFYIIQHSDIKSKLLCSVGILLQRIFIIQGDVKYPKSIEIGSLRYLSRILFDADNLKLTRYPILRVLGNGFDPSLVKTLLKNNVPLRFDLREHSLTHADLTIQGCEELIISIIRYVHTHIPTPSPHTYTHTPTQSVDTNFSSFL